MTPAKFSAFWRETYPATIPLTHFLKWGYPDRWFRVHSLPDAKRYADREEEWAILLARQTTLLDDLLGSGAECYLVTGDYSYEKTSPLPAFIEEDAWLQTLAFQPLELIDLHAVSPEHYEQDMFYHPVMARLSWEPTKFMPLLKAIANDETRAFLLGVPQQCLVAPYDGGVDVIVANAMVRDAYKGKYAGWF